MSSDLTFDQMFPSKWLTVADLNGQAVKLTIAGLNHEPLQDGGKKWCLHFRGTERIFGLNKTNASMLRELFGEPGRWINQPIILYPTTTDFKGVPTPCVRLRAALPPEQRVAAAVGPQTPWTPPEHVTVPIGEPAENYAELDHQIPF